MNWDIQLNEEVDLLRETVRQFAEKRIAPIADEIDRNNEFPQHLWKELGELGLLGITVPEEYGGSGMSYLAHLVAVEEISRASAPGYYCSGRVWRLRNVLFSSFGCS